MRFREQFGTSEWLADQEAHHQVGDLSVSPVRLIDPTSKCLHMSPNLRIHDLFQASFGGTLKELWSNKYLLWQNCYVQFPVCMLTQSEDELRSICQQNCHHWTKGETTLWTFLAPRLKGTTRPITKILKTSKDTSISSISSH